MGKVLIPGNFSSVPMATLIAATLDGDEEEITNDEVVAEDEMEETLRPLQ